MKRIKLLMIAGLICSANTASASRAEYPAYHGTKDGLFNWCGWFANVGMARPFQIFCIDRA